jgi:hypothetical protein
MRGSNNARRIDAGGVDPRRGNRPAPPLFRVHDPLSWLNVHSPGAAMRMAGRADRKPGRAKPFWILGGMMVPLLAAAAIGAAYGHAKPRIEQTMVHLGEGLAHAIHVDCVDAGSKGFPDGCGR